MRGQKSDEGEFVTKLVGIKLDVHIKISQIPCKIFVAHIFFTDHLKLKAANKTSCGTPSANTLPAMCKLLEELSNCYDYFSRLSGFPDLFTKVF